MTPNSQPKINKRTAKQNKALHCYFSLLAETLNEAGLEMKVVLKPDVAITWTKQNVKDYLWRPVQEAYIKEHSTTQLKSADIDKIFDIINRHLVEKFGQFCEFPQFPSIDELLYKSEIK